ncbi:TPA: hypothetical protein DDW35_00850 [Candidatus Sumerlaeota bacterium]|nr:hypothetical protein [Candidatus Sumerlaeota bacterium]
MLLRYLLIFLLIVTSTVFAQDKETPSSITLRVAVPPDGLLAPPILRMVKQASLASNGITIECIPWKNQDQLRALIVSGKTDIVGLHLPTAALFESKGVPVKFLGASLGNVLYILTNDPQIHKLSDLRDKTVAVPMRGEFPDVLLRSVLEQNGLLNAVPLQYTATSLDAANQLASGADGAALVAEPHASVLLKRMATSDKKIYRSISMQEGWNAAHGTASPLPTAGMAAIGKCVENQRMLDAFWSAYVRESNWCIQHPQEAVALLGDALKDDASREGAATALSSCVHPPVASGLDREQIQLYLDALGKTAPEPFGNLHPKDTFYWKPSEEKR